MCDHSMVVLQNDMSMINTAQIVPGLPWRLGCMCLCHSCCILLLLYENHMCNIVNETHFGHDCYNNNITCTTDKLDTQSKQEYMQPTYNAFEPDAADGSSQPHSQAPPTSIGVDGIGASH